ncbi:TIGR01777 family oxidoreductase [Malaciobacter mytili]|uniref:TIGR01777 family oxidoreductase n=1 Tax=Malaciobacter mytili TaxID=603050 RepID=UPI003BB183CE
MKTIAITGASGFVGSSLTTFFQKYGYKVVAISRDVLNNKEKLQELMANSNIVINLAGANIISRWTAEYKQLLYSSRIDTTSKIVEAINNSETKPELLISTSAVGIYDNKDTYDEKGNFSNDFLSTLCQRWEEEAKKANTKVSIFRFGIVLGKKGGAFAKMLTPFKLGLGGVIGSGNQAFSFIHIDDLLNAYKFVIDNNLADTFNLTAPKPTTNLGLTRALGKAVKRPTFFPVPEFVLKLIFSEGAKVLTDGQDVVPKKLLSLGFKFKYNDIQETVNSLV